LLINVFEKRVFFFIFNCFANFAAEARHSRHLERRESVSLQKELMKLFLFFLSIMERDGESEMFFP
jgi:hypothetical protein